jgi:hypothetical protein
MMMAPFFDEISFVDIKKAGCVDGSMKREGSDWRGNERRLWTPDEQVLEQKQDFKNREAGAKIARHQTNWQHPDSNWRSSSLSLLGRCWSA